MPTPFTHLEIAQRLLSDTQVNPAHRDLINAQRGAFLLGNIAADARVGNGAPREATHFYRYGQDINSRVWRQMTDDHPRLMQPHSPAHQAFVAGYVAHLTVDETWSMQMVAPHFAMREWGDTDDRMWRFFMLHIILIYMDQRDYAKLEAWQPQALTAASPHNWLDFISDDDLKRWQTLIYDQIKPDGEVQTLEIFARRIGKTPADFSVILDSETRMQDDLWANVSQATLHQVETQLYANARREMGVYLDESAL